MVFATKIHRSFLIWSSSIHKPRHSVFCIGSIQHKNTLEIAYTCCPSFFLLWLLPGAENKVAHLWNQMKSPPLLVGSVKALGEGKEWKKSWRHEDTICFPRTSSCGSGEDSLDKNLNVFSKAGGINFTLLISEHYTAILLSIALTTYHCKPEPCLLVERVTFHVHSLLS